VLAWALRTRWLTRLRRRAVGDSCRLAETSLFREVEGRVAEFANGNEKSAESPSSSTDCQRENGSTDKTRNIIEDRQEEDEQSVTMHSGVVQSEHLVRKCVSEASGGLPEEQRRAF
jgi:DNA-directed RNA polymerase specialized sigma24 family protein